MVVQRPLGEARPGGVGCPLNGGAQVPVGGRGDKKGRGSLGLAGVELEFEAAPSPCCHLLRSLRAGPKPNSTAVSL